MLFILTGTFQTGKTRWLERLVQTVQQNGFPVYGVIAPGQWRDHGEDAPEGQRFEKLGIDNVLLPQQKKITFARRPDLAALPAQVEGGMAAAPTPTASPSPVPAPVAESCKQSSEAKLGWAIDDAAIDQVNAHFCTLCGLAKDCMLPEEIKRGAGIDAQAPERAGLLVVDELGPLELMRGGGLTSAMDVLSQGPSALCAHALIVVRESLYDVAATRFSDCWGGATALYPTEEAAKQVLATLKTAPNAASEQKLPTK